MVRKWRPTLTKDIRQNISQGVIDINLISPRDGDADAQV